MTIATINYIEVGGKQQPQLRLTSDSAAESIPFRLLAEGISNGSISKWTLTTGYVTTKPLSDAPPSPSQSPEKHP